MDENRRVDMILCIHVIFPKGTGHVHKDLGVVWLYYSRDSLYLFSRWVQMNVVPRSTGNTNSGTRELTLKCKWALCTIRSHGTKLYILVSKLRSGASKTKAGPGELVRVALFWKSHCATCSPVYIILYHVTGSCKGPAH